MLRKFLWLGMLAGIGIMLAGIYSPATAEEGSKAQMMDMKGMMGGMMEHGDMPCMPCQRGESPGKYLEMADELGLSEAQASKLREIKIDWKKLMIQKKSEMEIISLEIDSMVDMPNPDQSDIESKIDDRAKLKADLLKGCLKASLDARKVLTPEQYKQAKKIAKKMSCPMMGEKEKTK